MASATYYLHLKLYNKPSRHNAVEDYGGSIEVNNKLRLSLGLKPQVVDDHDDAGTRFKKRLR